MSNGTLCHRQQKSLDVWKGFCQASQFCKSCKCLERKINFATEVLGRVGDSGFLLSKCVACAFYLVLWLTNTCYFCEPHVSVSVVDSVFLLHEQ